MRHLTLLLCLILSSLLHAQFGGRLITRISPGIPFTASKVLLRVAQTPLPQGQELRLLYVHRQGERMHAKYQQYYRGRRVLNGTVVFHAKDGELYATSGVLQDIDPASLNNKLSGDQGATVARLHVTYSALHDGLALVEAPRLSGRRSVVAKVGFPTDAGPATNVWGYTFEAATTTLPIKREVFVDAATGRVINHIDHIHTERVIGTGEGFYNGRMSFRTDSIAPGDYRLQDFTRGGGIIAKDIARGGSVPTDADNDWVGGSEGQRSLLDGYVASQRYYDMLFERFGRHSIDDNNHPLIANMNQYDLVNAFWNGEEATIGNGNCGDFSALTTYEIISHEFTHGLTQYTSNLIYQDESGALNEAISDIFGKALEYDYDRENFNWNIGEAIRRNENSRFFRSMADPNSLELPAYYKGEYWYSGSGDAGGVHYNSGVLNHWFYLLVQGKRGTNEAGVNYDVSGIGMTDALDLVYLLQTAYLTESSNYADCHELAQLAAADLWGSGDARYLSMQEAWKAVGLPAEDDGGEAALPLEGYFRMGYPGAIASTVCSGGLENGGITFANFDQDFPAGLEVSGSVIYEFFGAELTQDTVVIPSFVINEPTDRFTDLVIEAGTNAEPDEAVFALVTLALEFNTPAGERYAYDGRTFVEFSNITEVAFELTNVNIFSDGDCLASPEEYGQSFDISLPICNEPWSGTLNVTFENDGATQVYTEEVFEATAVGYSTYVSFSDFAGDIDIASLGGLNGATSTISLIDGRSGEEISLHTEDLSGYYTEVQNEPFILDFSNAYAARRMLGFATRSAPPVQFEGGRLKIPSADNFASIDKSCIPPDEFFGSLLTRFGSAGQRTVSLCLDTEDFANPLFSFALEQAAGPELPPGEASFAQGLYVVLDGEILTTRPISATGAGARRYEFALPQGFAGTLQLIAIVLEGTTYLDDFSLTDALPTSLAATNDNHFGIRYTNPATQELLVTTDRPVPTGTQLSLYDGTGRRALTINMTTHNRMDVARLPAGAYYLRATDGVSFQYTGKVIINN